MSAGDGVHAVASTTPTLRVQLSREESSGAPLTTGLDALEIALSDAGARPA
jgi:hypothetical protein